jgi:hypothetical protein
MLFNWLEYFRHVFSKTKKISGNKWQAEPFSWKAACCPTKYAAKEAAGSAHAVSFLLASGA